MQTDLEEAPQIVGKSVNYLKITVTPVIENNLLMIIRNVSDNLYNEIVESNKVVEVIFEVSLN